jgi:hypothetical protein
MKAIIDKIEDVAEGLRGEYTAGEGGKFYLKLEGLEPGNGSKHPAVAELLNAKQHSNTELQTVKQELQTAKQATKDAQDALHARLSGKVDKSDLEALEKSWGKRLEDTQAEHGKQKSSLESSLREVLVTKEATAMAARLAVEGSAPLLAESIVKRLSAEVTSEGKAITRVLGPDGKPSAATLADLEKEIVATPMYSPLLLGSKASGSGAARSTGASGAGTGNGSVNWMNGNPTELAEAAAKSFTP